MSAIRLAAVPLNRLDGRTGSPPISLWKRLADAAGRYRQRRALADLDERLLDDIGVTRGQADAECRKPLWR